MPLHSMALAFLLLGLGLAEAGLLRAAGGRQAAARAGALVQARAGVRQIPISIPLRVPFFMPIDGPTLEGELAQDEAAGEPQDAFEPAPQDGPTLGDIMGFARAMSAPRGDGAPPKFPGAADGVTIRMKASEMPAPLHMEETDGGLVVTGRLPGNLNASTLNVNQLGDVVEVQYRMGEGRSAVGVNQRFELDFEPQELSKAKYSGVSGQFTLDIPKPKDAVKPRKIVIAFDNTKPEEHAESKVVPKVDLKAKVKATAEERVDAKVEAKAGEKGKLGEAKAKDTVGAKVEAKVEAKAEAKGKVEAKSAAQEPKKTQAELMAEEAKARRHAASAAARASSAQATVNLRKQLHAKPLVMIEIDNN